MTRQERAMEWGKCVWGGVEGDTPTPTPQAQYESKRMERGMEGAYKVTDESIHGMKVSLFFQREVLERNVTMYT